MFLFSSFLGENFPREKKTPLEFREGFFSVGWGCFECCCLNFFEKAYRHYTYIYIYISLYITYYIYLSCKMNGNSSTVEEKFSWWQVLEIDPIESLAPFPSCGFLWQSPRDLKNPDFIQKGRNVQLRCWSLQLGWIQWVSCGSKDAPKGLEEEWSSQSFGKTKSPVLIGKSSFLALYHIPSLKLT